MSKEQKETLGAIIGVAIFLGLCIGMIYLNAWWFGDAIPDMF